MKARPVQPDSGDQWKWAPAAHQSNYGNRTMVVGECKHKQGQANTNEGRWTWMREGKCKHEQEQVNMNKGGQMQTQMKVAKHKWVAKHKQGWPNTNEGGGATFAII